MPTLNTVIKQASRGADLYFVFRFLRLLTMKYEKTAAYKLGIIDKKGKPLKRSSELESVDEKAAYTMLHRLVFKIRRLIEKVPIIGKSILLNYAAALFLLKEQNNPRVWTDENYAMRKLNEFIDNEDWVEDAKILREEVEKMNRLEFKKYLAEDGHTDVASAKNQVKIAMDALQKMNTVLATLPDDGSLPTWWTNKVAIAVNNLDGMADYLDTQVEQVVVNLMQSLGKRKISESNVECVKTLKKIVEQVDKRGPCWVGYVQQGMKKKGGKLVPNCVPEQVGVRKVDFVDGVTEDSPPPVNAAPTAPDSGNVQYQAPVLGKKKKKKKIDEAKIITSTFAGKQVFVVDSDMYHQCRLGKQKYHRYEKYVGNKRIGKAIREYGLKHPKRPIILQNGENGPMLYLRYGRS